MSKIGRRELFGKAAAVAAVAAASACVPTTQAPGASAGGGAKVSRELVMAYTADLTTMDPAKIALPNEFENAIHVYNGLVHYSWHTPTVGIDPDLAERWDVAPDGKTYTFFLRKGVQFHKGFGELTSDDVKFHYERLKDPATKSQAVSDLGAVQTIEAPDKYTVRFNMSRPYPNFLDALAAWRWTLIPSRKAVEQFKETYAENPVGTGPYVYESRVPRQEIRWSANKDYWNGAPSIDRLKLVVIPDESVAALALQRGEVHAMKVLTPSVYKSLKSQADVQLADDPGLNWYGFFLNTQKKPLDNVKVRQALANVIDREAIAQALDNSGAPAYSIIPPAAFGFSSDVPKYPVNVAEAKRLLADAGYPNGGFTLTATTRSEHAPFCQVVAESWKQIGVTLKIDVVESGALAAVAAAPVHAFDILVGGIGRPTAEQQLVQMDGRVPPQNNYAGFKNARVNQLIDQLATDLDPTRRKAAFAEIQRIIATEVPVLPFLNLRNVVAYHKSVTGFARNLVNQFIIVKDMSFK